MPQTLTPESCPQKHACISDAKLRANRENAQHSTGPTTSAGLERSSKNALKSGLTGKSVLLPSDDPELYAQHLERLHSELKPAGELELQLVQRIADAQWRLNRIPELERNLYKLGRLQFAYLFENEPQEDRPGLIQAHTAIAFQSQFKNFSIQEMRIRRGYTHDLDELKSLQSQRGKIESDHDLLGKWPAPWPGGRKNGFEFAKEGEEPIQYIPQLIVTTTCDGKDDYCLREASKPSIKTNDCYSEDR